MRILQNDSRTVKQCGREVCMRRDGTGADVVSCPNCICVCAVAFCLRYNEQTPSSTLCSLFGLKNK